MPSNWKTPHDWVTGAVVTETQLDEQVRDHALVTGWHVLQQYVATAAASAIDFVQIPQGGYESLRAQVMGRGTQAAVTVSLLAQFSSDSATAPTWDTATNYAHQNVQGNGTGLAGLMTHGATAMIWGSLAAGSAPAGNAGWSDAQVFNHARGDFNKGVGVAAGSVFGTSTAGMLSETRQSAWRSTSPVKAIRLFVSAGNISSGTVATLYGLRGTSSST